MKYYSFIIAFSLSIASYAQITDDLIMFYNMNNNSLDMSGNNNDGTLVGIEATTNINDEMDAALYFDDEGHIILPDDVSLKPNLPISLSMMVKPSNFDEVQALYHSDKLDNNYAGFFVNVGTTGQVMAHIGGDYGSNAPSNRRSFLSNDSLIPGEWQYVTIIISAYNDMRIFIDCRESEGVYSGSGSTEIIYTSSNGSVGAGGVTSIYPNGYFYVGAMDELALWERALDSSEIDEICDGSLSNIGLDNIGIEEHIFVNTTFSEIQFTLNEYFLYNKASFELYNSMGQLVVSSDINSLHVNVQRDGLASGLYMLVIKENQQILTSRKLILP